MLKISPCRQKTRPSILLTVFPSRRCSTGQTDTARYFLRLLSRHTLLYTEMVTTGAIIHGKGDYLAFSEEEHPVALQLGGSDPAALAHWREAGRRARL
ncbi:tRNA-dihydrouridine synthase A [Leclercia adecarboxylata]|uniref:tRNA-dihydrouridine synthase A n=1 Tax=Leclercia adecarboxylata TaxID=83655 RepID=A0A4U9HEW9_9ENTR|nr:tRNA-dihydrouridine synthase A [Leclercia adecarboxylata]